MNLYFSDGTPIRGDLIRSAVIRTDLSPVPVTLEAEILAGEDGFDKKFAEGETLKLPSDDSVHIVKSVRGTDSTSQNERQKTAYRITAVLKSCLPIAYVRQRAICKENSSLCTIYKSCGATINTIDSDFPVPRFYCFAGSTPSFQIAKVLQEEGGVVRWRRGKLQFMRLLDLFSQKPVTTIAENALQDIDGGFLERHQVPFFYSVDDSGAMLAGNNSKARFVAYSPFKNQQRLRNMTRCLVQKKIAKILLNLNYNAGDVVELAGGEKLAVITAAHVWQTGIEGNSPQSFTRLWLGTVEE